MSYFLNGPTKQNETPETMLQSDVSEFHTILAIINRAGLRGLPGGVHGAKAEVIVDSGAFGALSQSEQAPLLFTR